MKLVNTHLKKKKMAAACKMSQSLFVNTLREDDELAEVTSVHI